MLAIDSKDSIKRLRYCFNYLNHSNEVIALDAYNEFVISPDEVIGRAARSFSPEKLRKWLRDEKTGSDSVRLYGFLLGNCGNDSDADLLRGLLDRFARQENPPPLVDGIISGYVLLRPKKGWDFVRGLTR